MLRGELVQPQNNGECIVNTFHLFIFLLISVSSTNAYDCLFAAETGMI